MSGLTNPYAVSILGKPLAPAPMPQLRAEGAPMSRPQLDMARWAFRRFMEQARLSYAANPSQHGFLPDGSRYRIETVSGAPIMQVWPITIGSITKESIPIGAFVFHAESGEFYAVWYNKDDDDVRWKHKKIKMGYCGYAVISARNGGEEDDRDDDVAGIKYLLDTSGAFLLSDVTTKFSVDDGRTDNNGWGYRAGFVNLKKMFDPPDDTLPCSVCFYSEFGITILSVDELGEVRIRIGSVSDNGDITFPDHMSCTTTIPFGSLELREQLPIADIQGAVILLNSHDRTDAINIENLKSSTNYYNYGGVISSLPETIASVNVRPTYDYINRRFVAEVGAVNEVPVRRFTKRTRNKYATGVASTGNPNNLYKRAHLLLGGDPQAFDNQSVKTTSGHTVEVHVSINTERDIEWVVGQYRDVSKTMVGVYEAEDEITYNLGSIIDESGTHQNLTARCSMTYTFKRTDETQSREERAVSPRTMELYIPNALIHGTPGRIFTFNADGSFTHTSALAFMVSSDAGFTDQLSVGWVIEPRDVAPELISDSTYKKTFETRIRNTLAIGNTEIPSFVCNLNIEASKKYYSDSYNVVAVYGMVDLLIPVRLHTEMNILVAVRAKSTDARMSPTLYSYDDKVYFHMDVELVVMSGGIEIYTKNLGHLTDISTYIRWPAIDTVGPTITSHSSTDSPFPTPVVEMTSTDTFNNSIRNMTSALEYHEITLFWTPFSDYTDKTISYDVDPNENIYGLDADGLMSNAFWGIKGITDVFGKTIILADNRNGTACVVTPEVTLLLPPGLHSADEITSVIDDDLEDWGAMI